MLQRTALASEESAVKRLILLWAERNRLVTQGAAQTTRWKPHGDYSPWGPNVSGPYSPWNSQTTGPQSPVVRLGQQPKSLFGTVGAAAQTGLLARSWDNFKGGGGVTAGLAAILTLAPMATEALATFGNTAEDAMGRTSDGGKETESTLGGIAKTLGTVGAVAALLPIPFSRVVALVAGISSFLLGIFDLMDSRQKRMQADTNRAILQSEGLYATHAEAQEAMAAAAGKSGEAQTQAIEEAAETFAKADKSLNEFTASFEKQIGGKVPESAKRAFKETKEAIKDALDPESTSSLVESYRQRLFSMRMDGERLLDATRKLQKEIQGLDFTPKQRETNLRALRAASDKEMAAARAAKDALNNEVGNERAGVETVEESYKARLDIVKDYYRQVKLLQDASVTTQHTEVWGSAASEEEARKRIKEIDQRAAQDRIRILEEEHERLAELRQQEFARKMAAAKNDEEEQKKLREEYQKEERSAEAAHQRAIQKYIDDTQATLQKAYQERFKLVEQQSAAYRESAAALDQIAAKARTQFENLQSVVGRAAEETQRAIDLLPTHPEKAMQVAKAARQAWVGLTQDVRGLEARLRNTGEWYAEFYRSIAKKRMSATERFRSDARQALTLQREAAALFGAGDFGRAQEQIRKARDLMANLVTSGPKGMQSQALEMMRGIETLDKTIARTVLDDAKALNETATTEITRLNDLIKGVWESRISENTKAIQDLTSTLKQRAPAVSKETVARAKDKAETFPAAAMDDVKSDTKKELKKETKTNKEEAERRKRAKKRQADPNWVNKELGEWWNEKKTEVGEWWDEKTVSPQQTIKPDKVPESGFIGRSIDYFPFPGRIEEYEDRLAPRRIARVLRIIGQLGPWCTGSVETATRGGCRIGTSRPRRRCGIGTIWPWRIWWDVDRRGVGLGSGPLERDL